HRNGAYAGDHDPSVPGNSRTQLGNCRLLREFRSPQSRKAIARMSVNRPVAAFFADVSIRSHKTAYGLYGSIRGTLAAGTPRIQNWDSRATGAGGTEPKSAGFVALFRLVESEREAEQRQAHLDRLLVGVLHRDLQLVAGAHGGEQLVR